MEKKSLKSLRFVSEIRVDRKIKVCQADLTIPPRTVLRLIQMKTNRQRNVFFFFVMFFLIRFTDVAKSQLLLSVSRTEQTQRTRAGFKPGIGSRCSYVST